MDFAIFSAFFLTGFHGSVFDEIFINGYEDHDISLQFFLKRQNYALDVMKKVLLATLS